MTNVGEASWLFWFAVAILAVPMMSYVVYLFAKMAAWGVLTARKRFDEENHLTEKEKPE